MNAATRFARTHGPTVAASWRLAARCVCAAFAVCLAAVQFDSRSSAAEINSNATGGGRWSDKETWRGGVVPGPLDDVVLTHDDVVTFDRDDEGRVTCRQLMLDPRSVLQFKTSAGPIVMRLSGKMESFGSVKLDATRAAGDRHELHMVAKETDDRVVKIAKGGALIVAGRAGLAKGKHNSLLLSLPLKEPGEKEPAAGAPVPDPSGVLHAEAGSTLDVQRADVVNVYMQASYIDNTGAKVGERINILRNHFTGTSRLLLTGCDTPIVADNLFEREGPPAVQQAALYLNGCPLAEVRNNVVRGAYAGGISGYGQSDTTVVNNLIENCPSGFYWVGNNAMIRQLTIRNCNHGMTLTSMSGALEDVTIEGSLTAYYHGGAAVQFTNLDIRKMQKGNGYVIYYSSGPLTLLNCNIQPQEITWVMPFTPEPDKGKPRKPTVQSLNFVVAKVGGDLPAGGATVEVRTMPPVAATPGAADPNVRNSPARLSSDRLTPLPKTLEAIVVRGWSFDAEAKPVKPPEYVLNVLAPPTGAKEPPKVLKSTPLVAPDHNWYRPKPDDKQPTLEVTLP